MFACYDIGILTVLVEEYLLKTKDGEFGECFHFGRCNRTELWSLPRTPWESQTRVLIGRLRSSPMVRSEWRAWIGWARAPCVDVCCPVVMLPAECRFSSQRILGKLLNTRLGFEIFLPASIFRCDFVVRGKSGQKLGETETFVFKYI